MKKNDSNFQYVPAQENIRETTNNIYYIKDLNESFNNELLEAGGNMEVTFKRNGTDLKYYFLLAGRVWTLDDDRGDIRLSDFNFSDTTPSNLTDNFSITQTPDVMFPRKGILLI